MLDLLYNSHAPQVVHKFPWSTASYHHRGVERIEIFAIGISAVTVRKTLSLDSKLTEFGHDQKLAAAST